VEIVDLASKSRKIDDILDYEPKIVGLSVVEYLFNDAVRIAEEIRKESDTKIVFGGYYPTFEYKKCLELPTVDFVIRREGEIPLKRLADYLLRNEGCLYDIPGIAFKKNGKIYTTKEQFIQNLDTLPLPDFDLIDLSPYKKTTDGKKVMTVVGLRGCKYSCNFCSPSAFGRELVD
jgi:radical SAM superfamily enzyme YgiQ (UPF0313 family)